MKKLLVRISVCIIIATMIFSVFSGCKSVESEIISGADGPTSSENS